MKTERQEGGSSSGSSSNSRRKKKPAAGEIGTSKGIVRAVRKDTGELGGVTEGMAKDQGDLEGGNRRRTALKAQQGSFVVAASTPKGWEGEGGVGVWVEGSQAKSALITLGKTGSVLRQTAARVRANQSKMDNKDNKEGRKEENLQKNKLRVRSGQLDVGRRTLVQKPWQQSLRNHRMLPN
ncbi:hypothetical protein RUM43_008203 [Polyplax serrata]|uniref:Uncharacterized protein n=1 Tax=Polyplax serrata TaxID=468196 RepID=A0AAN8PEE0_POLSC